MTYCPHCGAPATDECPCAENHGNARPTYCTRCGARRGSDGLCPGCTKAHLDAVSGPLADEMMTDYVLPLRVWQCPRCGTTSPPEEDSTELRRQRDLLLDACEALIVGVVSCTDAGWTDEERALAERFGADGKDLADIIVAARAAIAKARMTD